MLPRPSVRLGRAFSWLGLVLLLVGLACCGSAAETLRSFRPAAPPPPVARYPRPLSTYKLGDLPLQRLTPEQADQWMAQTQRAIATGARPPAPPPTTPQFFDLTTNPRPPQVGTSSLCRELHPAWSWDQQSIYFTSNNVNPVATYGTTAPLANSPFHIYRITSDGSFNQQITGTQFQDELANDQFFPALNRAQSKIAYVHRTRVSEAFQLYVLDLFSNQRVQLTGVDVLNNALNADIVSVEHPSWSPGDNLITFAARRKSITGDVRNIYTIDVVSRQVRRLTSGSVANGVECIDPVYHPTLNNRQITFAANSTGLNGASGDLNYTATTLADLRKDGSADDMDHNLFHVNENGPSAGNPVVQYTTGPEDDIEPAYQQAVYPPGQGTGAFNNYLAWASLGRIPDVGVPARNSFDIYFANSTTPADSPGNPVVRLFTPDATAASIALHQTDERYPTWSSALPPRNAINRIAFTSNRQNNVNDQANPTISATDSELWAAEVTDITPPSLFTMEDGGRTLTDVGGVFQGQDLSFLQGEVLHISNARLPNRGSRVGAPGEAFFFYATVRDLQYGINSVWAQIKDPDGPATDSQGQNHKLYGNGTFTVRRQSDGTQGTTHRMQIPYEMDAQGINVSDYTYFNGSTRSDVVAPVNTQVASRNPGVDDAVAWSGNQNGFDGTPNAPRTTQWLQMKDDGVAPDDRANDGVFSAQWVTPPAGSDFYVDLIAYDNAFNPQAPAQQQNWILYDNIWGFSTEAFSGNDPVLVVDDHGNGQKWPRGLKGAFRTFSTYRLGTEGEVTSRPTDSWPREIFQGAPRNIPDATASIFAPGHPALGNELYDFLNGDLHQANPQATGRYDFINWATGSLQAYRYDLWRILARGPVAESVINDYVPNRDAQPTDITGATTIQRAIPRRAVVWNAPYMGDIFIGSGSILDQATQTLLTSFRDRAGRLLVSGGDVLWALTINGSVQQNFVRNVLGADFTGDINPTNALVYARGGGPIAAAIFNDAAFGNFTNPLGGDTAGPFFPQEYDLNPIGLASIYPNAWDGVNNQGGMPPGAPNVERSAAPDAVPFQQQDGCTARAGFEQILDTKMVGRADNATQSKTLFLSASLASFGRRVFNDNDDPTMAMPLSLGFLSCQNYKSKFSHAMFCWLFSANVTGQVRSLAGGVPVAGAFVEMLQGGVVGTAFTRPDGTYQIRGLPVGSWSIRVTNPGFLAFNKDSAAGAHGLGQDSLDVLLTPGAPASISGKVTDAFAQPVPNARVKAALRASPLFTGTTTFITSTLANGTYLLQNLPVGTYDVSVDMPFPDRFDNPTPASQQATLNPAQNTPNVDFQMRGNPGPLTVRVFEQLANGTQGPPVDGAEVTLLDAQDRVISGFTAVTGARGVPGQVIFSASAPNADVAQNVPAGPTKVTAFKIGLQEGSIIVNIPQQNQLDILLAASTPRPLFGTVRRKIDGLELQAADLSIPVALDLLRQSSKLPVGRNATVFAPPLDAPLRHNYRFDAQQGLFTVALRNHPRWFDASADVAVAVSGNTTAPDIILDGRDGRLSGLVREDNGGVPGVPIPGVTVQIVPELGQQAGQIVATAVTGADGRFRTAANVLTNRYRLTIRKFGHSTRTLNGVFVAGDTDIGTVLLVRADRGQIFGLARRSTDGVGRDNVLITFTPDNALPNERVTVTTGAATTTGSPDGAEFNYTLGGTVITAENLPIGNYTVSVTGDPRFQDFAGRVTVDAGVAKRFDLDLVPNPGLVTGIVRERNPDGSVGLPVDGATVQALRGATVVSSTTTAGGGRYTFPSVLAGGSYTVQAAAFGFLPGAVQIVVEGNTTAPDILISRVAPSTVIGTVRSSVDGAFIGDATISILTPSGGPTTVVPIRSTAGAIPGTSPAANFTIQVPPGTFLIRAQKTGWKGPDGRPFVQLPLAVSPGVPVNNINLVLVPDHVFGQGLLLISLPDDFSGQDAADVLDQPRGTFRAATFVTPENRYAIYPEAPANEFRSGRGAFVRFASPTAFTKAGAPTPNAPFALPIRAGWNLIGSVRRDIRIEWLRVQVLVPDRPAPLTLQEAMDQGIIQNGLFGFLGGYFRADFLEPFNGYFARAFRDCTLIIPVNNGVAQVTPAARQKIARLPVPSLDQVAREAWQAGLGPKPGSWNEGIDSRRLPGVGRRPDGVKPGHPERPRNVVKPGAPSRPRAAVRSSG